LNAEKQEGPVQAAYKAPKQFACESTF
jgi:hypothetical protein